MLVKEVTSLTFIMACRNWQNLVGTLELIHFANGNVREEYLGSYNSSPNLQDYVTVSMDFTCLKPSEASLVYVQTACPWE